ncbi:MAG: UDP-3-O-acyl-N-acetylglucosamine deacetylase [Planctomycetes bacterium]|nr:UDP-3-O-acyl-N-acetylglucosamine deacetylase [Planctomycetota bacterium]
MAHAESGHARNQRTLRSPVRLEGFGYWSGRDVALELRPAPAGSGIVFVRTDLPPPATIPARTANRLDLPRRTAVGAGRARVEMIEHVMAALAGLRIDNCEVRLDGAELPAFDGSSLPIAEAIHRAGAIAQAEARPTLRIARPVRIEAEGASIEGRPSRTPGLTIEYELDYGPGPIGRQWIRMDLTPDAFLSELAPARTFLLEGEADRVREQGLGARVTYRDLVIFGKDGPVGNRLRFDDECVRHKALDLVGDLALGGFDIEGHVIAIRSGHRLNADFVRLLEPLARLRAASIGA